MTNTYKSNSGKLNFIKLKSSRQPNISQSEKATHTERKYFSFIWLKRQEYLEYIKSFTDQWGKKITYLQVGNSYKKTVHRMRNWEISWVYEELFNCTDIKRIPIKLSWDIIFFQDIRKSDSIKYW